MSEELAELKRAITTLCNMPFPEKCEGRTVAGVVLENVDTKTVGCLATFIKLKGGLDETRRGILKDTVRELRLALPELDGDAEAQEYFALMEQVAARALDLLGDPA
ncbi:MAG: hypothetical protein U0166_23870 [Acidobacteriota bacterium]